MERRLKLGVPVLNRGDLLLRQTGSWQTEANGVRRKKGKNTTEMTRNEGEKLSVSAVFTVLIFGCLFGLCSCAIKSRPPEIRATERPTIRFFVFDGQGEAKISGESQNFTRLHSLLLKTKRTGTSGGSPAFSITFGLHDSGLHDGDTVYLTDELEPVNFSLLEKDSKRLRRLLRSIFPVVLENGLRENKLKRDYWGHPTGVRR